MDNYDDRFMTYEEYLIEEKRLDEEAKGKRRLELAELEELKKKYGSLYYGRWGQQRLDFMKENIFHFWDEYPDTYPKKKIFLDNFNEECMTIYRNITRKAWESPDLPEDYMERIQFIRQHEDMAEEFILHEIVYKELYYGFPLPELMSWEDFLKSKSKGRTLDDDTIEHMRNYWEKGTEIIKERRKRAGVD